MVSRHPRGRLAIAASLAALSFYGCASLAGVETLTFVADDREGGRPDTSTPDVLDVLEGSTADASDASTFDATLVGVYAEGTFFLARSNAQGAAAIEFTVDAGPKARPFAHHTAGARDTVGWFEPDNSTFYFLDENRSDAVPMSVQFGDSDGGANSVPVVGDWKGAGASSVGFYNPLTGFFFLKDDRSAGVADYQFQFGAPGAVPFAGDWKRPDAGASRVGVYFPDSGAVFLSYVLDFANASVNGAARPGATHSIAGEWGLDPNAGVTIGTYDADASEFRLYREQQSADTQNQVYFFQFGVPNPKAHAIAGRWKEP